jgi:hypothetical protein
VRLWLRAPQPWGKIAQVIFNGQPETPPPGDIIQFSGFMLKQRVEVSAHFH